MVRRNPASSWLDVVAGLLSKPDKRRRPRLTRRLGAERLEGRAVLSVAPVPVESFDGSESLAEYLAVEQEMGPTIPAELAAADSAVPEVGADLLFGIEQGSGYGEAGGGEGEGSGSGSGGYGSGSGSGSGSGGPEEPTIPEPEVFLENGNVTVAGQIEDDGNLEELTLTLEGGIGTVSLDAFGNFVIQITDPNGNERFTITVTDDFGNTTTYTFDYPT